MTKVLTKKLVLIGILACLGPAVAPALDNPPPKPAQALYLQLGQVGLDPARVYEVRDAAINRSAIQISLDDGMIGFTQDVMGKITGAFFEGDGEILLSPPNEVERRSMSLFTGMAILEERFSTAYFRFNDDLADELRPDLRQTDDKQEFIDHWTKAAQNLAASDAMRLLVTFSRFLPEDGAQPPARQAETMQATNPKDKFLHARLQGTKLGVFDVFYDSNGVEQIQAGQSRTVNDETFYNVWTSFSPIEARTARRTGGEMPLPQTERAREDEIRVHRFTIKTEVLPPKQIHARALLECDVPKAGSRILFFELSRFLQVESVKLNGQPLEFIHNPALEGSELARTGNDLVAVILPEQPKPGTKLNLDFVYGGEVLAEAGSGLLYVGARGTWYPNRGMEMANFDLQFTYPPGWTLVATGTPVSTPPRPKPDATGEQTSRWVSDRPIPVAGFNLGQYRSVTAKAGSVTVDTYATRGVEKSFPSAGVQVVTQEPLTPLDPRPRPPEVVIPTTPSPAQNELAVSASAVQAIQYYSERFGPYPYHLLSLTQLPGRESQGWPGLVFLSSFAFLTDAEREALHFDATRILLQHELPAHEIAHQWWGDLITWDTYRDQWFSEGLANYCALMMLQEKNPAGFRDIMNKYRLDLITKNKDGMSAEDVGPVTLGTRLLSSRFPAGYEAISYGRGTWLFHMLRTMLKDAQAEKGGIKASAGGTADEPFVRALRKLRERYEGKTLSTRQMLDVFAEELPPALRYEGKSSFEWFLNGWINGTSLPKLELKGVKFTVAKNGKSTVTGTLLQKEAPDDLVTSVPIYALITGRQPVFLGRIFADGNESPFHLSAPLGARKLLVDPYETVLTSPK
ncbi:MAG TPA: M1 family aminopeptidase [Candidatus Sulfotelmatobacter sp.]|nr:M1 family aminopeptidase [Candidatus Sulfotelmatobacter sp.]